MATVMTMEWAGVSPDQYNQVMKALDLDHNPPAGGIFHVSGFSGGTMRVLDIWDSQQMFEKFQKDRLEAAVMTAGIQGQPKVQFYPAYNIFVPNMEFVRSTGSSSLPSARSEAAR